MTLPTGGLCAGGVASIFRALEALAVLGDVGGFFFWVAMILLLG
jgi:hypothetical protein